MNGKRDVDRNLRDVKRQIYARAETQLDFRKNMERIRDASRLTCVSIKCTHNLPRPPRLAGTCGLSPARIARHRFSLGTKVTRAGKEEKWNLKKLAYSQFTVRYKYFLSAAAPARG